MVKKRIGILTPVLPPYHGGIGKAALDEAEMLARDFDVTIFTPKYSYISSACHREGKARGDLSLNDDRLLRSARNDGVYEEQRGAIKIKYIKPLFQFGNAAVLPNLPEELKVFDIIYLHYPFFGVAEKFINSRFQIPDSRFIIRYHMDVLGRGFIKPFFWLHMKLVMPKILGRAKKIIVSSFDYTRNSNIKNLFACHPERFAEIPFGADTEKFTPLQASRSTIFNHVQSDLAASPYVGDFSTNNGELVTGFKPMPKDSELLAKHNLKPEDKILLFVGSLDRAHYFKGLDILLKAVRESRIWNLESGGKNKFQIPNSKFQILVVGDGDLRPHYENLAKKLGISELVKFVGKASNEDLPKYYNLADIFVFPSIDRSEAFGIALLEAMSCGRAVVASDLPGVRTLVKDGQNGFLVKSKDVTNLMVKINQALSKNKEMGEKSREIVLEKYDRTKIESSIIDVFKSLL